jgi:hypothetical protein
MKGKKKEGKREREKKTGKKVREKKSRGGGTGKKYGESHVTSGDVTSNHVTHVASGHFRLLLLKYDFVRTHILPI